MHDLDPEPNSSEGPLPGPGSSGLVQFLVGDASAAGVSREALVAAVQALLRERDYLRHARDLQHADREGERAELQDHVDELEELLESESVAHREQAGLLQRELAAYRELVATLESERDALRADRDAWQERATRTLRTRIVRRLKRLLGSC
ncbi:MAG: hypothetical protein AAFZ65_08785 [Planctomycetota bacterium]